MKKILLLIPFVLLSSRSQMGAKDDVISLYNDKSRLYIDKLEENESCLLKTYHHKKYGDVAYVAIDEFCETFDKTDYRAKQKYAYDNGKFIVSGNSGGTFTFDAKKDTVTTSIDVDLFTNAKRGTNNGIPNDMYKKKDMLNIVKESSKTK